MISKILRGRIFLSAIALIAYMSIASTSVYAQTQTSFLDNMWISSDPSATIVELMHEIEQDRHVTLRIPRSALVFSAHHSGESGWPSRIEEEGTIAFAVVAPDGNPLGEAIASSSKQTGAKITKLLRDLRSRLIKSYVRVLTKNKTPENLYGYLYTPRSPNDFTVESLSSEGLRAVELRSINRLADGKIDSSLPYRTNGRIIFLGDSKKDNFDLANCILKPGSPLVLCDYYKVLAERVDLRVKFVDFRFHGGRKFLNQQMSIALGAYCRFDENCGWVDNE